MKCCGVLLAAGSSNRFGSDKLGKTLSGEPVWLRSFRVLSSHPAVTACGIVCPKDRVTEYRSLAPSALFVVAGGDSRQESSHLGCAAVPESFESVLVHDAARPFVSPDVIDRVVEGISRTGAAAPGVPVQDTLRQRTSSGYSLIDRERFVAMQTPQGALREHLLAAHQVASEVYTDEMELLAAGGFDWVCVPGDPGNFKLTYEADWLRAQAALGRMETRTGLGFDIHRFSTEPTRPLWLGGVLFPNEIGLDGHSDADVVIHAVVDALLGAAALGDIGVHFPNTDPRWKDVSSLVFLSHAHKLLLAEGWSLVNLDISVQAERPKIMPRALEIRTKLAEALGCEVSRVSIKATTMEGIGALGKGEGVAAYATATISTTKC